MKANFEKSSELVIRADGLGKSYRLYRRPEDRLKEVVLRGRKYHEDFWALRDIDLKIGRGETIGIIGRNGSGKSTLLQLLCGTLRSSAGELEVRGRIAALLELGAGFNPEFTGRENVWVSASVLGLKDKEIEARFESIAEFAGIGEFIDQPVKHYSSGMYARLAFAVCAHVDADILIVDEILAVGDAAFQQKCMRYLHEFRRRGTLLFVSHDTGAVVNLCDRALWLDRGTARAEGAAKEVCRQYLTALAEGSMDEAEGLQGKHGGWRKLPPPQVIRDSRWGRASIIELSRFDPDAPCFGHGGAVIEDAGFYEPGGARLSVACGGEEVELRIRCRAERQIDRPIIGFIVRDRLGQNLFGDNTYPAYGLMPPQVTAGQSFTATFRFQMPHFALGEYTLSPAVVEGTQQAHMHLHWMEDAVRLRAVASPIRRGLLGVPMKKIQIEAR